MNQFKMDTNTFNLKFKWKCDRKLKMEMQLAQKTKYVIFLYILIHDVKNQTINNTFRVIIDCLNVFLTI